MTKITDELFTVVDEASKLTLGHSDIVAISKAIAAKYVLIPREDLPEIDTDHPEAPDHAYVDGMTFYWYEGVAENIIEDAERELAVLAHIQDGNKVGE